MFRGMQFYRGLVTIEDQHASIFVINQVAKEAAKEEKLSLFVDGTFNVSPIYSTQLLIVIAKVKHSVSSYHNF